MDRIKGQGDSGCIAHNFILDPIFFKASFKAVHRFRTCSQDHRVRRQGIDIITSAAFDEP